MILIEFNIKGYFYIFFFIIYDLLIIPLYFLFCSNYSENKLNIIFYLLNNNIYSKNNNIY